MHFWSSIELFPYKSGSGHQEVKTLSPVLTFLPTDQPENGQKHFNRLHFSTCYLYPWITHTNLDQEHTQYTSNAYTLPLLVMHTHTCKHCLSLSLTCTCIHTHFRVCNEQFPVLYWYEVYVWTCFKRYQFSSSSSFCICSISLFLSSACLIFMRTKLS